MGSDRKHSLFRPAYGTSQSGDKSLFSFFLVLLDLVMPSDGSSGKDYQNGVPQLIFLIKPASFPILFHLLVLK